MFGKNETPSVGIIDSQSVKTTQKGDPEDMMLKKKGRKRHIVVDTVGLIIAADVDSASVQDRDGALNLFTQAKYKAPTLRKFFADQGYIAKPLFIGDRIRLPRKLLMLQDYFDNLDHNLALQAIKKHTDCKWVILYVKRWMKSPIQQADGSKVVREKRSSARRFNKPNHFKHIYAPCI